MTEILEYALVFATSTIVVAFSLGFYSSYSNTITYSEERATFASVVTVAVTSIEHGGANVTLDFNQATLSCSGDELFFVSPSYSSSFALPAGCDIPSEALTGIHTLVFSTRADQMQVVVD